MVVGYLTLSQKYFKINLKYNVNTLPYSYLKPLKMHMLYFGTNMSVRQTGHNRSNYDMEL